MARARSLRTDNTWPGFVDALATLLLVIMFLLVVFMLAHFFQSQALTGRDAQVQRLNARVNALTEQLAMERAEVADLQRNVARISSSLLAANQERDELALQVRTQSERADAGAEALVDANREIEIGRETVTARLGEIERLNRDLAALRELRDELETEVGMLALALDDAAGEADRLNAVLSVAEAEEARREEALAAALLNLTQVRDRASELGARLSSEQERTALAQLELEDRDLRLAEVQNLYNVAAAQIDVAEAELTEEQRNAAAARSQIVLLNEQLAALRLQLLSLQGALDAAEARDEEQQVVIETLGQRLNVALAQRVEELSRFRSEFFGRLRDVLDQRQDIRIEGDRFIFQSEVLFAVGEAELGAPGQAQLAQLADTLLEISEEIPEDIGWVLRVDGHTDSRPINTPQFPSNWELSTARAVSVVTFLIGQGVPAQRLAATGFGEFQPIDPRDLEAAYQSNRRIELKLTER